MKRSLERLLRLRDTLENFAKADALRNAQDITASQGCLASLVPGNKEQPSVTAAWMQHVAAMAEAERQRCAALISDRVNFMASLQQSAQERKQAETLVERRRQTDAAQDLHVEDQTVEDWLRSRPAALGKIR